MAPFPDTSREIRRILRKFLNEKDAYQWFLVNIYKNYHVSCSRCHRNMKIIYHLGIPFRWRCNRCTLTKSFFKDTIYENGKTKFHRVLLVILLIYLELDQKRIRFLCNVSKDTVRKYQILSRRMELQRLKDSHIILGGPGKTVQLDEAIIRKRKFNRGRSKEQIWVFGAVEDDSSPQRKLFLTIVKDRKASTLLPIIQDHIPPGTRILTDEWKGYLPLSRLGYEHFTVNHKNHFADPATGINTNRIEGVWAHMRRSFPRNGVRKRYLEQYLCRFMSNSMTRITFREFLWRITFFEPDEEDVSEVSDIGSEVLESEEEESDDTNDVPSLGSQRQSSSDSSDSADLMGWGTGESASEWEP